MHVLTMTLYAVQLSTDSKHHRYMSLQCLVHITTVQLFLYICACAVCACVSMCVCVSCVCVWIACALTICLQPVLSIPCIITKLISFMTFWWIIIIPSRVINYLWRVYQMWSLAVFLVCLLLKCLSNVKSYCPWVFTYEMFIHVNVLLQMFI